MLRSKAAQRYALALHQLARETGCVQPVLDDMEGLRSALERSADLRRFLGNYSLGRAERRRALGSLLEGRLHPLTWRFVLLLETRKRLGLAREVCRCLRSTDAQARGVARVIFTGPFPLQADEAGEISGTVRAKLGRPVDMTVAVRRELLGGFRLQVDDRLYDFSVATALESLRRRVMAS